MILNYLIFHFFSQCLTIKQTLTVQYSKGGSEVQLSDLKMRVSSGQQHLSTMNLIFNHNLCEEGRTSILQICIDSSSSAEANETFEQIMQGRLYIQRRAKHQPQVRLHFSLYSNLATITMRLFFEIFNLVFYVCERR